MQEDQDEGKQYRWQSDYEKTWEVLKEDEKGHLESSITELLMQSKRKRMLAREAGVRLGIMRHVFMIMDMSQAMNEQDLKPTRHLCTLKILGDFVPEFHEQNSISQLGIITTLSKQAKKHSSLTNNPQRNIDAIKKLSGQVCKGEPSLQNSLEVAHMFLKHLPAHTSREIIIIYGALTTCDPGEIEKTFEKIKKSNIRVSVIGLAAELHACKRICKETKGSYVVCLNDVHLKELLMEHLEPPPATQDIAHTLIKVGFPHQVNINAKPAMCMCHLEDVPAFNKNGYYCPQCTAKYCDLPAECRLCGLMLVTAPHLARSYRHLFPLAQFKEITLQESPSSSCYGCVKIFNKNSSLDKTVYRCESCHEIFCFNCDIFLHDTVHSCPGCASNPTIAQNYGHS